jgi:flagellar basal body-associated protein FliL
MPDQNDNKREMRMMWIFSAAVVLLILGAIGINMLVHHGTSAAPAETTQAATEPPK